MDLRNTHRVPCAEPLESRQLLSGLPTSDSPVTEGHVGGVQVLEVKKADDDDDTGALPLSQLPDQIVAALDARFPGARFVEADFNADDGAPEFGISAEFNGRAIEVTLRPTGEIVKTDETVSSSDLPRVVRDWVRENFPRAKINQALKVTAATGDQSYEIQIDAGQQEYEAILRPTEVHDSTNPSLPSEPAQHDNQIVSSPAHAADLEAPIPLESSGTIRQPQALHEEPAREYLASSSTNPPGAAAKPQDELSLADGQSAGGADSPVTLVARTVETIVANASPVAMLPQLAELFGDVVPIDAAGIEQRLRQTLDALDSLAQIISNDGTMDIASARLALIGAIIIGAQLALRASGKIKDSPVLSMSAANPSWSWVVGSVSSKRR